MTQSDGRDTATTWLTTSEAAEWLQHASLPAEAVQQMGYLRKHLRPEYAQAIAQQLQFRSTARRKFRRPEQMLFTDKGLQQATDERVSCYKAQRFATATSIVDLCCGIGGDSLGFASHGLQVDACDSDEICATFARFNLTSLYPNANCRVLHQDAAGIDVSAYHAWHIDPDRRPTSKRTTKVEFFQPNYEILEKFRLANAQAAIKVAPATVAPEIWQQEAELEWISSRGECRQQMAWFGDLTERAGQSTATRIAENTTESVCGLPDKPPLLAEDLGSYLIEPDPAVLAANLSGEFSNQFELASWSAEVAYLTADHAPATSLGQIFHIEEQLPFDLKRLKQLLRSRQIGRVEIKKRAFPTLNPAQLQKQLRNSGPKSASLLLAPYQGQMTAFICQRVTAYD